VQPPEDLFYNCGTPHGVVGTAFDNPGSALA
jgi:hypothetical protein